MPREELLFKVIGSEGHEFAVYTNGRIEGFGEGALVFNFYPELLATAYVAALGANGIDPDPCSPTSRCTEDAIGAGHSAPLKAAINTRAILAAPGEK